LTQKGGEVLERTLLKTRILQRLKQRNVTSQNLPEEGPYKGFRALTPRTASEDECLRRSSDTCKRGPQNMKTRAAPSLRKAGITSHRCSHVISVVLCDVCRMFSKLVLRGSIRKQIHTTYNSVYKELIQIVILSEKFVYQRLSSLLSSEAGGHRFRDDRRIKHF
jgi:hypothetical protein